MIRRKNKTPATRSAAGLENPNKLAVARVYDSSTGLSTSMAAGTMLPSSLTKATFSRCSGFFSLSSRIASGVEFIRSRMENYIKRQLVKPGKK